MEIYVVVKWEEFLVLVLIWEMGFDSEGLGFVSLVEVFCNVEELVVMIY